MAKRMLKRLKKLPQDEPQKDDEALIVLDPNKTPEEQTRELLQALFRKLDVKLNRKLEFFFEKILKAIAKTNIIVLDIKKENSDTRKIVEEGRVLNENVDATLCNVLLAIRQNEYLQAWYPEQTKFKLPQKAG